MTEEQKPPKWFFKTSSLVIAFLCVGPFALPLVWFNPLYSKTRKIVLTVVISVLTLLLVLVSWNALRSIMQYYNALSGQLQ